MNKLFLDIHAIQSLPPSNINRDDIGSPKTALYGGVNRARVSSQSWKKAMRDYFKQNYDNEKLGTRTRNLKELITERVLDMDNESSKNKKMTKEEVEKLVTETLKKVNLDDSKVLFFIGHEQANKLAEAIVNDVKNKGDLIEILKEKPSIDIALFGRMMAKDASLSEGASSQVAHAISVHGIQTEFDFFTATDDFLEDGGQGAAMLETTEFNSPTLYRYANVAVHDLLRQLENEEDVIDTIKLFIKAFVNSLPSGKMNSFANQTIPSFIMISLREDRPINLVSSFENPIKSQEGFSEKASLALVDEYDKVHKILDEPVKTFILDLNGLSDVKRDDFVIEDNFKSLIEDIGKSIEEEF